MQETYEEFIQNILNTRGRFACGDEYHERHHIVPKSCGGGNEQKNLIDLYAREHFEAHRLLALENPNNEKLVYAWWCMTAQKNEHTKERYIVDEKEYEEAKLTYINMLSGRMSGSDNPMYGISPRERMDDETYINWLAKITEKSRGENNPMYGKHHSKETKEKIKEKLTGNMVGEKNPFFGKQHSEETKAYLREINLGKKMSQESKELMSKSHVGKNNPKAHPLYCYELNEFFWGAIDVKSKYENIPITNIPLSCKNSNRTCGIHPITGERLNWRYATKEEYENYIERKGNDINGTMEEE